MLLFSFYDYSFPKKVQIMLTQEIEADQLYFPRISQQDLNSKFKELVQIDERQLSLAKRGISQNGEQVVLKYYKREALNHFKRSFTELKKLNHPNIIKWYDCYSLSDDEFVTITEYCAGGSLKSWIKKGLSQQEKYDICLQLAEGLEYLHSRSIIQLDLKPSNIFISQSGVAKIEYGCKGAHIKQQESMKSVEGCPAQNDKTVFDEESKRKLDIWSLGLVYFYVFKAYQFYDNSPFPEKTVELKDRPNRIQDVQMKQALLGINTTMQDIIKNCLKKDEKLRYTPQLIAKKIKKLQQSQQYESKVHSTSDCQNKEDELKLSVKFACRIMSFHSSLSKNRKIEATKMQLFETFLHNQQNLNKLENIQQLLFVKEATKAQFTVIVLLYYMLWLNEFQAIIVGQESSLAQNYRSIDKTAIDQQTAEELMIQIQAERARVKPVLKRSSQIARNQLKLLKATAYLPQKFKDMLQFGLIGSESSSHTFKLTNLKHQMSTFFDRRIKREYFNECKDDILDERLNIIGQIGKGFV